MKIYFVGGVVCDVLLNIFVKDCDFLVVGLIFEEFFFFGY